MTLATEGAFANALRAAYVALTPGGDRAVPGISDETEDTWRRTVSPEVNGQADAWATWVERAAIREFCGDMSRAEAEVRTTLELGPCPREPGLKTEFGLMAMP